MEQLAKIKKILEQIRPELAQKYHVQTIGLFGSLVRDDFTSASDVDILVDFDRPIGIEFVDMAEYIEHRLGRKVYSNKKRH